jgi:hypothetical protein
MFERVEQWLSASKTTQGFGVLRRAGVGNSAFAAGAAAKRFGELVAPAV